MSGEDLRRLSELFDAALELPEARREEFLERECAGDLALREKVAALLRRHEQIAHKRTLQPLSVLEASLDQEDASVWRDGGLLGAYRLQEEIGRGGMGRVFRGSRATGDFEQEVAIKLVRRDLLHPGLLKRFSTERAVLASLGHPGICSLIDAGETADGTPFVVMELVRGKPLLTYCDDLKLDLQERLQLFRRVLDAVAHAHRNLVVHRDIKSSNVLVTVEGQPKLLDFGIAKPLHNEPGATATAERFFTPSHAAPEQLRGGPTTVGCDVYSLGVLLYELLVGRLPFDPEKFSAGELERMIVSVPAPTLAQMVATQDLAAAGQRGFSDTKNWRRALVGDIEAIVQRALRKDVSERYATIEQFDADLDNFLAGLPVAASGGQTWYRIRKFVARHKVAVGIAATAVLALAATLATIALQNLALTQERNRAVAERDRAQYAVGILKQAFLAADPAKVAGAEVTAQKILAAAIPELDKTFETQPELFASLATTIAEVQLALGLAPQAAALAARASDAARRAQGAAPALGHLLILESKSLVGAGDLPGAEQKLVDAERLGSATTPDWLFARSRLLNAQQKPEMAIPLLEKALRMTAGDPPTDELATSLRWQLAESFRRSDKFDDGLQTLDATLRWQRAGLSEGHPSIVRTRLRRVEFLRQKKRHDEAALEAEQVALEVDRHYGAETAYAAVARTSLGLIYADLARNNDAAREYRSALLAWRRGAGNEHKNTLLAMTNLASILSEDPHNDVEAEALFREASAAALRRYGAGTEFSVYFRVQHAEFLLRRKRAVETLALLTEPEALEGLAVATGNRDLFLYTMEQARPQAGCPALALDSQKKPESANESDSCAISGRLLTEMAEAGE